MLKSKLSILLLLVITAASSAVQSMSYFEQAKNYAGQAKTYVESIQYRELYNKTKDQVTKQASQYATKLAPYATKQNAIIAAGVLAGALALKKGYNYFTAKKVALIPATSSSTTSTVVDLTKTSIVRTSVDSGVVKPAVAVKPSESSAPKAAIPQESVRKDDKPVSGGQFVSMPREQLQPVRETEAVPFDHSVCCGQSVGNLDMSSLACPQVQSAQSKEEVESPCGFVDALNNPNFNGYFQKPAPKPQSFVEDLKQQWESKIVAATPKVTPVIYQKPTVSSSSSPVNTKQRKEFTENQMNKFFAREKQERNMQAKDHFEAVNSRIQKFNNSQKDYYIPVVQAVVDNRSALPNILKTNIKGDKARGMLLDTLKVKYASANKQYKINWDEIARS